MPSLRSSPWMRRQPHLGFSLARRNTSSRTLGSRAADPQNDGGSSTSSAPVRDASAATSAASLGTQTSAPSPAACWRPRAAPDPSAAAAAARPSAAVLPADDGAPRSPPPAQQQTSLRRTPEEASAQPRASGRTAPPDRTDRPARTRIRISAPYRRGGGRTWRLRDLHR